MAALGGGAFHARKFTSGGCPGTCNGIEALRHQLDDAGNVQVVPQRVVESLEQRGILRIRARRLEIRNGQTYFLDAETGAGLDPVLRQECGRMEAT